MGRVYATPEQVWTGRPPVNADRLLATRAPRAVAGLLPGVIW
ncbi:hypothetical protein AB0945_08845 [Streptomyces sp. NPDC005474]